MKHSETQKQNTNTRKEQWNRGYSAQSFHMKIDARNWLVEIPVIKDLPLFQKVSPVSKYQLPLAKQCIGSTMEMYMGWL